MIKKSDFINIIFDSVRGAIQASEILNFLNIFTTSFDEVVSYDDFLKLFTKLGENSPT